MSYSYNGLGSKSLPRNRTRVDGHGSTVLPFRSANPGHLLRLDDTESDVTEQNDNHMSPLRVRTMKEYDQAIADGKKENFSLKLRIFFLEERLKQKFGSLDSTTEDIHRANIELKIEVEALKRDLIDKHDVLVTARDALDRLIAQHKAELEKAEAEHKKEKIQLLERMEHLEKLVETQCEGPIQSDSDMHWARAFSFMDNMCSTEIRAVIPEKQTITKEVSRFKETEVDLSSLKKNVKELEYVVDDLHKEIDNYKAQVKRLEGDLSIKMDDLAKQKLIVARLNKAFQKMVESKMLKETENIKLQTELQRINEELKLEKSVSNCKNDKICGLQMELKEQKEITVNDVSKLDTVEKESQVSLTVCNTSETLKKELQASNVEISRLRFILSSTEATVRMLGSKLNQYRRAVSNGGDYLSTSNRAVLLSRRNSICSQGSPDNRFFLVNDNSNCRVLGSASAPVTPMKGGHILHSHDSDDNHVDQLAVGFLEKEICRLRLTIDSKDQQLENLRSDFERTRPHGSCNDVAVQTDTQSDNTVCRKSLAAYHHACTLLRRRLEELTVFLERLLQFDENGLLDLSVLTPQKMASIRGHLEQSCELSSTLSKSLAVYDSNVSFFENQQTNADLVVTSCNSNNDDTVTSSHNGETMKSCNRSLFYESIVSGSQKHLSEIEDNLMLLLRPSSEICNVSRLLDEVPFSSLSSTFHESFLTSTNINGSRVNVIGSKPDAASESDSWSEPDRGVSQQRIGLDGMVLGSGKTPFNSPGRLTATKASTTSTESELYEELGNRLSQKAAHKWRADLRELKSIKSHMAQLEAINLSLRAELGLYQKVCKDNHNTASVSKSSMKVRDCASRNRSRNRNEGDTSFVATANDRINVHHQHEQQQVRLENHLLEISALRKKLEESIGAYDQLREQLEKRLSAMQTRDTINDEAAVRFKVQIEERDSALCSLHKEKSNLLLEIQQLSDDFKSEQKTTENLRAELREKMVELESLIDSANKRDHSLAEMQSDRDRLQQSLSRAQKLLRDNDANVKSLREANQALLCDLDNVRSTLREEKGKMDELVTELDEKNKTAHDLECQIDSLRKAVEEGVTLARKNFDEQMRIARLDAETKDTDIMSLKQQKSKLEEDLVQMRVQLQDALTLIQSLKTELSVFDRITSSNQNEKFENNVVLLVSEIRSLRLQLERSVEANTSLRAQLDDIGVRTEDKGILRLDFCFGGDHQYTSSVSSPDTASNFSYGPTMNDNSSKLPQKNSTLTCVGVSRQLSKSSDYVSDDGTRLNPTDVYSSPDLGIESDPNRCSSLERASSHPAIRYLKPGMPAAESDWTSVTSAPPKIALRTDELELFTRKRNCTFPLLRTLSDNGENSNVDATDSFLSDTGSKREIYVFVHQDHFQLLQKNILRSLEFLSDTRSKLKDVSMAQGLWKELRKCLQECHTILDQFWNVPLPLVSCDGDSKENRRMETELLRLHRDLSRERRRAEDALAKLEAADRVKETMEKAIMRQLNKTHGVLKKARGNLENQQLKTSSTKK